MSQSAGAQNKTTRALGAWTAAAALAFATAGCSAATPAAPAAPTAAPAAPAAAPTTAAAAPAAGGTIKIVSSLPRTGADKGQTDSIVNGYKMALEEVQNKVGAFTITFQDLDDGTPARSGAWDSAKEAENANTAVNDADVMLYLGTFNSGAAKVSIPILNRANLAMVSPANTYPGLTKPGKGDKGEPETYYPNAKRNYTRVVPADDLQGAVGAAYAKEVGVKKVYVLDDTELYGHGLALIFADTAKKLGMEVAGGPEGIDRNAADYRALALKVSGAKPDLVYFGGVTANNVGKLWSDLRSALGPTPLLMGPDGIFDQAFVDAAGPAAQGTLLSFGGVPPAQLTGAGKEWYTKYKDKYKMEPEVYAAYGYEAAKVALDAIKRAGKKDRAAIRDAVFATKDFAGVLGTWSFDANGDTSLTTMSINRVKGAKISDAEFLGLRQAPK
ncbi:MAG: branched-chain amino acid ABC transporter substrate-binding protein [Chloroflexi bacterium]|nr:branched-chain amino acid ABC transporter substrate-binding protein [Chloroflexota bacterium]